MAAMSNSLLIFFTVFVVGVDWILYGDEEKKKIQSIKKRLTGYGDIQNIEKKFGKEFIMNLKIELLKVIGN